MQGFFLYKVIDKKSIGIKKIFIIDKHIFKIEILLYYIHSKIMVKLVIIIEEIQ